MRVAVLYQELDPPIINGVRKPRKPGGYQDSGADIAFVLQEKCGIDVVTPISSPSAANDDGWSFPDTEGGILSAIDQGATHLWANTILFASHPLQTSARLQAHEEHIRIVGQPPNLVERFDDKAYLNDLLRSRIELPMPKAWTVRSKLDLSKFLAKAELPFPIVSKPVRGRGSYGVKVCQTSNILREHVVKLLNESSAVLLEEFLKGEEGTVTVMPPTTEKPEYWAMPVVLRFNHKENIAPYSGVVAVTQNSGVLSDEEAVRRPQFKKAQQQCEAVAELLNVTAPIRIDIRGFTDASNSELALFDINMKPNMTGPGRPGRGDQSSLTAIAATSLGWDYPMLLRYILGTAQSLGTLRTLQPEIL